MPINKGISLALQGAIHAARQGAAVAMVCRGNIDWGSFFSVRQAFTSYQAFKAALLLLGSRRVLRDKFERWTNMAPDTAANPWSTLVNQ